MYSLQPKLVIPLLVFFQDNMAGVPILLLSEAETRYHGLQNDYLRVENPAPEKGLTGARHNG